MIDQPKVSIILPSLNRGEQLIKTLDNIISTTSGIPIELIVILSEDDLTSQNLMKDRKFLTTPPDFRPVQSWNYGASLSSGEWLYLGNDDVVHPPNWLEKALATPNQGFIGLSDGRVGNWAPFFMVTREWCRKYQGGVFVVPHYKHWGVDPEICSRAVMSNTYKLAPIYLEHKHYLVGKSKKDSTYMRAEKYHKLDMLLYDERAKLGFPNDFEGYL
jgi:glycosyltransferase involved in cell wall biosynthesis